MHTHTPSLGQHNWSSATVCMCVHVCACGSIRASRLLTEYVSKQTRKCSTTCGSSLVCVNRGAACARLPSRTQRLPFVCMHAVARRLIAMASGVLGGLEYLVSTTGAKCPLKPCHHCHTSKALETMLAAIAQLVEASGRPRAKAMRYARGHALRLMNMMCQVRSTCSTSSSSCHLCCHDRLDVPPRPSPPPPRPASRPRQAHTNSHMPAACYCARSSTLRPARASRTAATSSLAARAPWTCPGWRRPS